MIFLSSSEKWGNKISWKNRGNKKECNSGREDTVFLMVSNIFSRFFFSYTSCYREQKEKNYYLYLFVSSKHREVWYNSSWCKYQRNEKKNESEKKNSEGKGYFFHRTSKVSNGSIWVSPPWDKKLSLTNSLFYI